MNRAVGGRQSSKNFRKELKRYTLADAFNGYNPNLLLQQQEESNNLANFIRIAPYNFNDDRDVLKRTASALQQKRTKKLISNLNMLWKPKAPSISLMAQDDGVEPTFHNPPMTPDLENYDVKSQKGGDRLNIQQASEDTFINSSVAPLSNKMSAKYKAKFGMATQSRTGVAKHTNSDIRGMPTHNQTAIAFLSQELAKNDNARYHNSSGQGIEDLLFGKVDYMNVGGSGHPDQQSKSQLPPSNFMEAIQSAEPLPETQAPKRKSHLIVNNNFSLSVNCQQSFNYDARGSSYTLLMVDPFSQENDRIKSSSWFNSVSPSGFCVGISYRTGIHSFTQNYCSLSKANFLSPKGIPTDDKVLLNSSSNFMEPRLRANITARLSTKFHSRNYSTFRSRQMLRRCSQYFDKQALLCFVKQDRWEIKQCIKLQ